MRRASLNLIHELHQLYRIITNSLYFENEPRRHSDTVKYTASVLLCLWLNCENLNFANEPQRHRDTVKYIASVSLWFKNVSRENFPIGLS
jgi:hypothetical protein